MPSEVPAWFLAWSLCPSDKKDARSPAPTA